MDYTQGMQEYREFTYDHNDREDEYNLVDLTEAFSEGISSQGVVGIFGNKM